MKTGQSNVRLLVIAAIVAFVMGGCATGPAGPTERPLYYGYGSGGSVSGAINAAKQDILRQVTPDLIGLPSASANREKLQSGLYESDVMNAYFFLDTMDTVAQGKSGDDYFYQIAIRVNLDAIARSLRALGIYGGQITPSASDELALLDQKLPDLAGSAPPSPKTPRTSLESQAESSSKAPPSPSSPTLTVEQQAIIDEYVRDLTFMVYFDEDSPEDPFIIKAAIGIANGYLTENRRSVVDLETVERTKKDQELVYEEETGSSVSLIQWIARKLNADVYAELDARTSSQEEGKNYYGQANLTMKFFESQAGTLLASVNYKSPRTFSRSSTLDAVTNALQSSVYEAMPVAIEQLDAAVRLSAAKGIPYQLVLQNTEDARIIRSFARKLKSRLEGMETVSQTSEETTYRILYIGKADDLMDLVFDVADGIPAFSGMELVLLRGRSLTFDTGM